MARKDANIMSWNDVLENDGRAAWDLAAYLGLAVRTIRERVKKMSDEYSLSNGKVYLKELM